MIVGWGARALQQCYQNVLCGVHYYHLPVEPEPESVAKDRVHFHRDPALKAAMGEKVHTGQFRPAKGDFKKFHGLTAEAAWRETTPYCSMQVVLHPNLVEIDYDVCNPDYGDAATFVGHGIEVLWPGKTDPFRIARGLKKRGLPVVMVEKEKG
jgi:hypothetical protein